MLMGVCRITGSNGLQSLAVRSLAVREEKTEQAVKTLSTSIKEKRIPRGEAPCIPFTKRNIRK
eukprot:81729-Pelagomonas_calceolata.AAC.1